MKTAKNYRLSPTTIRKLQTLKTMLPEWTETEIVEAAIDLYYTTERPFHDVDKWMAIHKQEKGRGLYPHA